MSIKQDRLFGQAIIFATSVGYEVIYPGGAWRQALSQFWVESTIPNQASSLILEIKENEAPNRWWSEGLDLTKHVSAKLFTAVLRTASPQHTPHLSN